MNRNDELMHYGVLGMKWGQRKARINYKKADKLSRKAARTKDAQKAAEYKSQAAEHKKVASDTEKYHIKMAGSKKAYDYTKNQSTGKALAKSYLMGTYGALKYNQARANKLDGRLEAGAKGYGYGVANAMTGGALSVVEPRISKQDRALAKAAGRTAANAARKQVKKRVK